MSKTPEAFKVGFHDDNKCPNDDKARAYERLSPFILHVMDCYVCHKQGTDKCSWIINENNRTKKPDVEIMVLPDNIDEAKKVLEKLK